MQLRVDSLPHEGGPGVIVSGKVKRSVMCRVSQFHDTYARVHDGEVDHGQVWAVKRRRVHSLSTWMRIHEKSRRRRS